MKPPTLEWVKKAEEDFLVASQIMRRKKNRALNSACFHCQQTIEKYLKARLIEAGLVFPRTHDLLELLHLLQAVEPLWKSYEVAAKKMMGYAVNFRYPGENATATEAKLALKDCKSLRAEVRRSLGIKK
ncbi:MAG TPA: HEPN domain-containing protein [Verrucomicrobiae bacterium]|jgi:HEPN domain-containing protein